MEDILMALTGSTGSVDFYVLVDDMQLAVLPKKSLEKRVFWEEFKGYEMSGGEIRRSDKHKDNAISRLSGRCSKSQKTFVPDSNIGFSEMEFFCTGMPCISLQGVFQDGYVYTGDFVLATTDTMTLYNFYNHIKADALVYSATPYSLRFRAGMEYMVREVALSYFMDIRYAREHIDTVYVQDEGTLRTYLGKLGVFCKVHNEDVFAGLGSM